MSTKFEIAERIDDIKDMLEKGKPPGDAMAAELSAKWNVSVRTVHRYIAHAKDIIDGHIQQREMIIQEIRSEAITEEVRNSILSSLELEARLCEIIEGKLLAERIVRTKDGKYEHITCLPSHRDIIYAIDKMFRKRGGYDRLMRNNETQKPYIKIVVDTEREKELLESIEFKPKEREE